MLEVAIALLLGSVVPEAEPPWPERIGVTFPFALGGAASVAAGAWPGHVTVADQDRAARLGNFCGFWFGMFIYLGLLAIQVR